MKGLAGQIKDFEFLFSMAESQGVLSDLTQRSRLWCQVLVVYFLASFFFFPLKCIIRKHLAHAEYYSLENYDFG